MMAQVNRVLMLIWEIGLSSGLLALAWPAPSVCRICEADQEVGNLSASGSLLFKYINKNKTQNKDTGLSLTVSSHGKERILVPCQVELVGANPINGSFSLRSQSPQKALPPHAITLGLGRQQLNFGGT